MKNRFRITAFLVILFMTSIIVLSNNEALKSSNDKEAKPWTYWWWMGSAVDSSNITYNLEKIAEAGIGGVHIIPIYGVKGYENKFIDFLSTEWMSMLDHTSEECARLDLGLDMSLGTGWPFGGVNVPVKYSSCKLIYIKYKIENNSRVSFNIIEEAKKKDAANLEMSVLSVNAYSKKGRIDLAKNVDKNGTLNWQNEFDSCDIIALVSGAPVQQVKRAAPGGKGNVVNPFSAEALESYLSAFDDAFKNNNCRMVRSFYHDSYEYYGADWSLNFLEEFNKRRKYNLLDMLPEFLGEGDKEIILRVKSDYRYTISELHEEFILTATEWSNSHGALFRNQAHGSPANILDIYAAADIPETEVFGSPRLDIPGLLRDTLFVREEFVDPLILKFSSSAAHVSGKNLISSETGTWLAEHFRESLSQIKPEIDLLFLSGINHIFFHGITYSPREEEWPGWQFYASTNYGPTNSFWRDIHSLNNYITRCQSILQSGKPDNDILVYFPVWDIWHSSQEGLIPLQIHQPEKWITNTAFYNTAKTLRENGYSFDYLSDKQLDNILVNDNDIISNNNKYRVIIIPACRYLPIETFKKLDSIIEKGGHVIFMDDIPDDVPGYFNYHKRQEEINKIRYSLLQAEIGYVKIVTDIVSTIKQMKIRREELSDFKIDFIRRLTDEGRFTFITNLHSTPLNSWVKLDYPVETLCLYDPLTDKEGIAKTKINSDQSVSVYLQLEPGESLFLKAYNKNKKMNNWKYLSTKKEGYEIKEQWDVQFLQGGPVLPGNIKMNKLKSWTTIEDENAKRFAGTAKYSVKFINPDSSITNWILDLGKVCESARVKINGVEMGTIWSFPFKLVLEDVLKSEENILEIEITNLPANRIRDLDIRGVNWKKYYDINFVNIHYKKFDASTWELIDSGLLGPVKLYPANLIQ